MTNILFCSLPWIDMAWPIMAPAVLKSCVEKAGYSAKTLDLAVLVFTQIKDHPNREKIIEFFQTQFLHDEVSDDIAVLVEQCAERIKEIKPEIVGLSLLSQDSQVFAWWLCYHLHFIWPEVKIVIGGSGIKNFIAQSDLNFASEMKKVGLIDDFIIGDGEIAVVEYLNKNFTYPGINSSNWIQLDDLDSMPFPNYDDYDFYQYDNIGIPICDSRGCVRTCEFCDIIEHWKKYKYRTAENIFTEMLTQIGKHKIKNFHFYNSLTNGNMKEFNKLLDLICEYNDNNIDDPIRWDGYFIVRNAKQHPEYLWDKIRRSNGFLMLGIESVVEHVRKGLGKNFDNVDIDYHLDMAKKYQVPLLLLLIVGYPTETKDDFDFTIKWIEERADYAKMPISSVQCTLSAILPGTKLERNQEKYGVVKGNLPTFWMSQQTSVTDADRLAHLNRLTETLARTGMLSSTDTLTHNLLAEQVNSNV